MIGTFSVKIKDSRNSFLFELKRNITILCGDSGKGKTTLYNMVSDYNRYGEKQTKIKIVCDRPVIAVDGRDWATRIAEIHDSIIIIDEDNSFIRSTDFANTIKNSSNYYLLITRVNLSNLPISVDEIYELTGRVNKKFKRIYSNISHIYNSPSRAMLPFKPEIIITEDSHSGFQFFSDITAKTGIECISANGNSQIYSKLRHYNNKNVLVVADGAAFGAYIRDIVEKQRLSPRKIAIFLPESFEWLILKSGVACDPEWEKVSMPEKYLDSSLYFSWERYFTDLLVDATADSEYKRYPASKTMLPEYYTHDRQVNEIKKLMNGIDI